MVFTFKMPDLNTMIDSMFVFKHHLFIYYKINYHSLLLFGIYKDIFCRIGYLLNTYKGFLSVFFFIDIVECSREGFMYKSS